MSGIPSGSSIPTAPSTPSTPSGTTTPPEPQRVIVGRDGQCFCDFASENGFRDCEPLRSANGDLADKAVLERGDEITIPEKRDKTTSGPNETVIETRRVLSPPATVRFVGLNIPLNNPRARGLTRLGISNYKTDRASATGTGTETAFYRDLGVQDDASRVAGSPEAETYADPDHFRVEIHDVAAAKRNLASVEAELQVLQPLYRRLTVDGKEVIRRDAETRPDRNAPAGYKIPTTASRRRTITCDRIGTTKFYRSRYMRLVTEPGDNIDPHTLFIGDYYDDGADNDEKRYTEILEQKVRVRYQPAMCTPGTCRVEALADVGQLRGEIRLAVHIMDNACTFEDVRRVVYKQVRRAYASAHTRPYIRTILRHPPPHNILLIGDQGGTAARASGRTRLRAASRIRLTVEGTTLDYNPARNQTVAAVCNAIRQLLRTNNIFTRELRSPFPPGPGLEPARMFLLFKDAACTDFAVLSSASSNDTRLSVRSFQISAATLGAFSHDGDGIQHRVLKACCNTDFFDGIVLRQFDTSGGSILFGIATWIHKEFGPAIIVQSDRMTPAQDDRYTFSHELGHVLMHGGHFMVNARREQLMIQGSMAAGNAYDMPGRRRISDAPMRMNWQAFDDAAGTWTGEHLLGPGQAHGTLVTRIHTFVKGQAFGSPTRDREIGAEW
jgi:hypothetical protein